MKQMTLAAFLNPWAETDIMFTQVLFSKCVSSFLLITENHYYVFFLWVFFVRRFVNRIEIDFERCKGCYLCIETCPRHLIEAGDCLNAAGYYPAIFIGNGQCTACALCATVCPDVGIDVFKDNEQ